MIVIKAPAPTFNKKLILPNPKLGDSYTPIRELNVGRGIDGTTYTYAKKTQNVRLLYEIELTRKKSLELEDFVNYYSRSKWLLTDHNNINYIVILVSNIQLQNFKRSWYNPSDPHGSEEAVAINLEFEGTLL